jgi:hypothetical protein
MAWKSEFAEGETGAERRCHARLDVAAAIMVSPNGLPHHTTVFDLSESGARIGLPEHFEYDVGALLRLYFPREQGPLVLFAEIKRMAVDHVGVEFSEGQRDLVFHLIDELAAAG